MVLCYVVLQGGEDGKEKIAVWTELKRASRTSREIKQNSRQRVRSSLIS